MSEITLGGQVYSIRKMPIFKQFHVSRMLAPIIFSGPKIAILASFARLTDEDAEYVVNSALEVTQRKQGDIWAGVGTLRTPMFDDMQMITFYEIAAAVVTESLGGFFQDLLSKVIEKPNLEA